MVKVGYHRLFSKLRDPEAQAKLYSLINLRIEGYGYNTLASLFHCDRVSIMKQCRKYGVFPYQKEFSLQGEISDFEPPEETGRNWEVMDGERVNQGHTYAEYLKKASMRTR